MTNGRDAEIDIVMLGARGKVLVIGRAHDGFSVSVLDKAEYERLVAERPHFTASTLDTATQMARQAVERE